MDGLGPGQNGRGTIHRRYRGAECVVDRRTFLFGWRWKRKERELRGSVDFEDDGRHVIVTRWA